ncbi:hypothetical protein HDV06_002589 [Boothiomyces sp. JEL0866]|nr:hypothetical protein HDV06_002589 [Boothiomyces sp. JEL0866]
MNFAIPLQTASELTYVFGISNKTSKELDIKIVSLAGAYQVKLTASDFSVLCESQSILSTEDFYEVSFRALTCNDPDTQKLIEDETLVWQYDALGIQEFINLGAVPLQKCRMTMQEFISELLISNAELNTTKQTFLSKIAELTQDRDLALSKYSNLVKEKEISDSIIMKKFKDLLNSKKRKIKNLMEEKNTQSQMNMHSQM